MSTNSVKSTVDVRTIEPRFRHPLIFDTFEELQDGEVLLLVNDHDPAPLRYQFEAEKSNQFAWEYIEQGPEVWQVHITKRVV
ncbi:DUF2249 domain-containing protein [Sedimenticola selenatireducens]|uniref:DUF2249 domain-containing protein n=1 Tax=Sedimenticola selenatireducens TaxID=191960 RepID=A0A557SEY6_9GAMM|nr:DUF2249 domain-containing protein [Sedimenticola selenatireducens]TVO75978.1 DUF2249 domain-containing protein [Sedimenticola selenatireducens]TVT63836.1 MAG: DUF2249 domain-containing protein [Sedimenticola selenatireducens]